MIRNDFVSNSSSSSFIISSESKIDEFINQILNSCYNKHIRKYSRENWNIKEHDANRKHLQDNINYTALFFDCIFKLTDKVLTRNFQFGLHTIHKICVCNKDIDKFVKDNKVTITWDNFLNTFNYTYDNYEKFADDPIIVCNNPLLNFENPTFLITKETVIFTRWIIDHCTSLLEINNNVFEPYKKIQETSELTDEQNEKINEILKKNYIGNMCVIRKDKFYEILDNIEKRLNNNETVIYTSFSYEGNGSDYFYSLYTDNLPLNDAFKDNNINIIHEGPVL